MKKYIYLVLGGFFAVLAQTTVQASLQEKSSDEYVAQLEAKLKTLNQQIEDLKPVTQETVNNAKSVNDQKIIVINSRIQDINKKLAHAKKAQKDALNAEKQSLQQQLTYANQQKRLSDAQLLADLQKKQNEYKKNLTGITQRIEGLLNNKTELSAQANLYAQQKLANLHATGSSARTSSLMASGKSALKSSGLACKSNQNPPTANLFIIEPKISLVDLPDQSTFDIALNQQKYIIRNSASPIAQWISVVDGTPSGTPKKSFQLFTVPFDVESTKFDSKDTAFYDRKNNFIDIYKQSITGTGPRSASLTDQKAGLLTRDAAKNGYLSIEPVCLSAGSSANYSTVVVESNTDNIINIYSASPYWQGNDNVYAYQFDLKKFWDMRDQFTQFLTSQMTRNSDIIGYYLNMAYSHPKSHIFDLISNCLYIASVNFKISFDIATTQLDVTPVFAYAGKTSSGSSYAFMVSPDIQNLLMPEINQWLKDQGIVTIIPNLSADKSLAAMINYPCTQSTGN